MKKCVACLCFLVTVSLLYSCSFHSSDEYSAKKVVHSKEVDGVVGYHDLLEQRYHVMDPARDLGVIPKVFAINLPKDLAQYPTQVKCQTFIELILPEVVRLRDEVFSQREKLVLLVAKEQQGRSLSSEEQQYIQSLAQQYGSKGGKAQDLLERVDIIPASLVLAQAILESGWGTSRFATEGNALYGEHVSNASTKPYIKSKGGSAKVAKFDTIYEATKSYVGNLNSHRAYAELRKLRAQQRKRGEQPDGAEMAAGLLSYSEIGDKYVKSLRYLIRRYKLEDFDRMEFEKSPEEINIRFS